MWGLLRIARLMDANLARTPTFATVLCCASRTDLHVRFEDNELTVLRVSAV